MACPNCGSKHTDLVFGVSVTKNAIATDLLRCNACDFLFLKEPSRWLDVAYQDSFYGDTGYMQRNLRMADFMELFLHILMMQGARSDSEVSCCDFGTGLGVFPRLMRDRGFDFQGTDVFASMELIKPFIARGLSFDVVTAFEVVEHMPSIGSLLDSFTTSMPRVFIFSTVLRNVGFLPPRDWWYFAFSNGQHISFHSEQSLHASLRRSGLDRYLLIDPELDLHAIVSTRLEAKAFKRAAFYFKVYSKIKSRLLRLRCKLRLARPSLIWDDHKYALSLDEFYRQRN